jgi:hypothetical protein
MMQLSDLSIHSLSRQIKPSTVATTLRWVPAN